MPNRTMTSQLAPIVMPKSDVRLWTEQLKFAEKDRERLHGLLCEASRDRGSRSSDYVSKIKEFMETVEDDILNIKRALKGEPTKWDAEDHVAVVNDGMPREGLKTGKPVAAKKTVKTPKRPSAKGNSKMTTKTQTKAAAKSSDKATAKKPSAMTKKQSWAIFTITQIDCRFLKSPLTVEEASGLLQDIFAQKEKLGKIQFKTWINTKVRPVLIEAGGEDKRPEPKASDAQTEEAPLVRRFDLGATEEADAPADEVVEVKPVDKMTKAELIEYITNGGIEIAA